MTMRKQSTSLKKGARGCDIPDAVIKNLSESFFNRLRRLRPTQNNYRKILDSAFQTLDQEAKKSGLYWNVGRSQKFFNILMKYCFTVAQAYPGNLRAKDRELVTKWRLKLHAPIDSRTLRHIEHFDSDLVKNIYWGWNMTDSKYLEIQCKIAQLAALQGLCPIAYEMCEVWVQRPEHTIS